MIRSRLVASLVGLACGSGCVTTMPTPSHDWTKFPKGQAFIGKPPPEGNPPVAREYKIVGTVRASVDFPTLDPVHEEQTLCQNYYNKAVRKLIDYAKENGGEAVIEVKSVTLSADGRMELHDTPECADEGGEGQVLVRGMAIKWLPKPEKPEESAKAEKPENPQKNPLSEVRNSTY